MLANRVGRALNIDALESKIEEVFSDLFDLTDDYREVVELSPRMF